VYDRQISPEQVVTFGVSGMLYRNGLIMYDHQTESLWSHIMGQAIGGQYQGLQLTFIPALHTDWQNWKELQPNTLVISPARFGRDAYAGYYSSGQEGVIGRGPLAGGAPRDGDIHPKAYVIGVRLGGEAKAYPFAVLNKEPVVNDTVGQTPIAVFFDQATLTGTVFDRRLANGRVLTFESGATPGRVRDTETGSEWTVLTGAAVGGELAGSQLAPAPVTYAFWFGWIDYHPGSGVYEAAETGE